MAWDFSTEPEFEQQLDWMRAFVRDEIWPLETIPDEHRQAELDRDRAPSSSEVQGTGPLGRTPRRRSSAGRASARSSSG